LAGGYASAMRILVTGGAGYVGSVSVETLVGAGHDVVVLDDLSTGHEWADLSGARLVVGSYGAAGLVTELLGDERIEAVLHCGARSLVPESVRDPGLYYRENVAGGIALLEAMRGTGVRRLVISSTASVYGEPATSPVAEEAPLAPINTYGETKRVLETAATWYGRAYGLRFASLRYFNVAGASEANGELHEPETHLIPNALAATSGGPPLTVFGTDYPTPDGTPIRDYVHVLDLAEAHRLALEATAPADSRTNEPLIANLGSGRGFSVREVLDAVERVLGQLVPKSIGPRRAGDPPALVASVRRAATVLGWQPRRSTLEEMIGSAARWRERHQAETGEPATAS
jgi:UDP-glucose 4-epimerase